MGPPPSAMLYESASGKEISRGAGRGPVLDLRVPFPQHLEGLRSAPIRMRATELTEQLYAPEPDLVRTGVWRAAAVRQSTFPLFGIPRHHL